MRTYEHIAVYEVTRYGRAGYVVSQPQGGNWESILDRKPRAHKTTDGTGLVGYVGADSFSDAVDRVSEYERTGNCRMS